MCGSDLRIYAILGIPPSRVLTVFYAELLVASVLSLEAEHLHDVVLFPSVPLTVLLIVVGAVGFLATDLALEEGVFRLTLRHNLFALRLRYALSFRWLSEASKQRVVVKACEVSLEFFLRTPGSSDAEAIPVLEVGG